MSHKANMRELLRYRLENDSMRSDRVYRLSQAATYPRVSRLPDAFLRPKVRP